MAKCHTISGTKTSDGFILLERLLHALVPKLGGTHVDPDIMISSLTAKNKESYYSFHSRAKAIEDSLKQTNSVFGPNKLLLHYLVQ